MTITSPDQTSVTPETERAEIIASLRALIDIFELIPEIPIHASFGWSVGGRDATAIPSMEAAAAAVQAAGIPHEYRVREHGRTLYLEVGGVRFDVSHLHDRAHADYQARKSYESVVQVAQDSEVSA